MLNEFFGKFSEILIFIGTATVIGILILIVSLFWNYFSDSIEFMIHKYKTKHKFDRQPIAKCYCIGCKYWKLVFRDDHTVGYCNNHYKNTGESYFCAYAKPKDKTTYIEDKDRWNDIYDKPLEENNSGDAETEC